MPIVALAVATLLLYAWRLDFSPPDLADDEVVFALQAHAIATTAHDLSGRLLPLYFQMTPLGETSWFHPVVVYFAVPFVKVLPFTEATVRIPTAVVGMLTVLLTYAIARRIAGSTTWALVAAGLLALTPANFMLSRLTADYMYPVPFVLGWLWCLLAFLDGEDPRLLFAGTLCLGVGVYSYIASLITMPFYFAVTLAVILWRSRTPARHAVVAAAGFGLPLLLIPLWLSFHPDVVPQTLARYRQLPAVPVEGAAQGLSLDGALREVRRPSNFGGILRRVSLYWYFFDPAYLFLTGGYANPINSTRHTGVFLAPLLVFVPVGLWRIATTKERTVAESLTLLGFVSAPVAAISVAEPYAVDREAVLMAFGALVAAVGVAAMWTSPHRWMRRATAVLLAIVPLQFALFQYEYYTSYRGQAAFWFGYNHRGAVEAMIARANQRDVPAFYLTRVRDSAVEAYWRFGLIKHARTDLLARTTYYDPPTLDVAHVPRGSLLMAPKYDPDIRRRIASGELRTVLDVPEIADAPQFTVLER
jgi:4-amino-4-deoxy-L-arabinose transferase-like glycosyltransferase